MFVLGLAGEWDVYGAGRGGKLRPVRKFSCYLRASVKDTKNIWLLFCMIYLHCKFYYVIKINYGGPNTGHVRPAGRSLETPAVSHLRLLAAIMKRPIFCDITRVVPWNSTDFSD
jgi:hypothetical protein